MKRPGRIAATALAWCALAATGAFAAPTEHAADPGVRWARPSVEAPPVETQEDDTQAFPFTERPVVIASWSDDSASRRIVEKTIEWGGEKFDFSLLSFPPVNGWEAHDFEALEELEQPRVVVVKGESAILYDIENTEVEAPIRAIRSQANSLDETSGIGRAPSPGGLRIQSQAPTSATDGAWVLVLQPGMTVQDVRDWVRVNTARRGGRGSNEVAIQVSPAWEGLVARALEGKDVTRLWLDSSGRVSSRAAGGVDDSEAAQDAMAQRLFGRIAIDEAVEEIEVFPLRRASTGRFSHN